MLDWLWEKNPIIAVIIVMGHFFFALFGMIFGYVAFIMCLLKPELFNLVSFLVILWGIYSFSFFLIEKWKRDRDHKRYLEEHPELANYFMSQR